YPQRQAACAMLERPFPHEDERGERLPGHVMQRELTREPPRDEAGEREAPARVVGAINVVREPGADQAHREEEPPSRHPPPRLRSSCSTRTSRSFPKNMESPTNIVEIGRASWRERGGRR